MAVLSQESFKLKLTDKFGLDSTLYTVFPEKISVKTRHLLNSTEYDLPLDHLSNSKTVETDFNRYMLIYTVTCVIIGFIFGVLPGIEMTDRFAILFVFFLFCLPGAVGFYFSLKKTYYLDNSLACLPIRYKKKDETNIEKLLTEIHKNKIEYIRRKINAICFASQFEKMISKLNVCLEEQIISQEEYEELTYAINAQIATLQVSNEEESSD